MIVAIHAWPYRKNKVRIWIYLAVWKVDSLNRNDTTFTREKPSTTTTLRWIVQWANSVTGIWLQVGLHPKPGVLSTRPGCLSCRNRDVLRGPLSISRTSTASFPSLNPTGLRNARIQTQHAVKSLFRTRRDVIKQIMQKWKALNQTVWSFIW